MAIISHPISNNCKEMKITTKSKEEGVKLHVAGVMCIQKTSKRV